MKVRVAGIVKESVVDGPGIRFAVFAQGCKHACKSCHNPETHALDGGELIDADTLVNNILESKHISGVTFSGGDPFLQPEEFSYISEKLKAENINIISYTGYQYEEIVKDKKMSKLLNNIDVLIDGRFNIEKKSLKLPFRGSSNQRIINIKASLEAGIAIETKL